MSLAVNILCYGDHHDLAVRCLSSILLSAEWSLIDRVQVALNAPCEATRAYAHAWCASLPVPSAVLEEEGRRNVGKYPMMRRMFHGDRPAAASTRVMWFDDDSFIRPGQSGRWWSRAYEAALGCTLLGSVYSQPVLGDQARAVRDQPWYAGRAIPPRFRFVQGAWWVADPLFLARWDYPFPALHHKGGDVMLGELCRQQCAGVRHFNDGVAINADAEGRESKSPRRGLSRDEPNVWTRYDSARPDGLSHHQFRVETTHHEPR